MSKTVEGVPESVTREQFTAFIEAFGFDPKNLAELNLTFSGVEAVVFERNEEGQRFITADGQGYAKHRVFIPVRNEEVGA